MKRIEIKKYAYLLIITALTVTLLAGCNNEGRVESQAQKGSPAPGFTLTDINGREWKLSDLKGKVVFLNFWASWCSPCLNEMPSMVALQNSMPDEYFQMLTIVYNDRPEYAERVIIKTGATFPVLIDTGSKVAQQYGLTGVPETFIIDTKGILQKKFMGAQEWNSQNAVAMIEHYFPKTYTKIVQ